MRGDRSPSRFLAMATAAAASLMFTAGVVSATGAPTPERVTRAASLDGVCVLVVER